MAGNVIYIEPPIIGEQKIALHAESKAIYELLRDKDKDEIIRLKKLMHLGALHYFSDRLFKYSRYDHVVTMLLLVYTLEKLGKKEETNTGTRLSRYRLNRSFSTEIDINGVRFTSISELLKSWILLETIGHLQMTFAAEHAFLRYLISNGHKAEFLKLAKKRISESKLFKNEEEDIKKALFEYVRDIIENEEIMRIYKIFTLLKIIERTNSLQDDDEIIPKLRELTKLMILRKDYLDLYQQKKLNDHEHIEKLNDVIRYFITIRNLAFTILDGYAAHSPTQLNYYAVLGALPLFVEEKNHVDLIKGINAFYTKTIYQSAEGAYYHLEAVKAIESVFEDYTSISDLIKDITSNKIDKKIEEKVALKSKEITNKKHQGNITEAINTSLELNIKALPTPISVEIEYLNEIPGTILYNAPNREHHLFIYPSLIQENKIHKLLKLLQNVAEVLYLPPRSIKKDFEKEFEANNPSFVILRFLASILEASLKESSKLASYILKELFSGNNVKIRKKKSSISRYFPLRVYFPLIMKSEYVTVLLEILKQNNISHSKKKKGKQLEPICAISLLKYYYNKKNHDFKWFLIALEPIFKLKNKEGEDPNVVEVDVVIIGVSPQKLMISMSEVKSGKHKKFKKQMEKQKEVFDQLKSEFRALGCKTKYVSPYQPQIEEENGNCKKNDLKVHTLYVYIN